MRALLAFDKFKHAATASDVCGAAARALRKQKPDWEIDLCPLSDGGDGFEPILSQALRAERIPISVSGPRGGQVAAQIGLVPGNRLPPSARAMLGPLLPSSAPVAIVEMAQASGLALLPPELRDPWQTSTYGTGQLLRAAAELGARLIVLGIGGSATNDLGLGALSALGWEFRAAGGEKIRPPVPASWRSLTRIDGEPFAALPPIAIASDVTNPLLGPDGCTAVFAQQKGLRAEDAPAMERAVERMAHLLCEQAGAPFSATRTAGSGAAGGLAFGLISAARGQIVPGFDLVSGCLDLDRRLAAADVVLTGEGRFDAASLRGKGPGALALRAAAAGKQVHVIAGQISVDPPPGIQAHALSPSTPSAVDPVRLRATLPDLAETIGRLFA